MSELVPYELPHGEGEPEEELTVHMGAGGGEPERLLRITRPVRYSLFESASGTWYLGYEERRGGSWSETSAAC